MQTCECIPILVVFIWSFSKFDFNYELINATPKQYYSVKPATYMIHGDMLILTLVLPLESILLCIVSFGKKYYQNHKISIYCVGLNEELANLENNRKCKMCRKATANRVVLPCGHLSLCSDCEKKAKACPLCKHKIQALIKAYVV